MAVAVVAGDAEAEVLNFTRGRPLQENAIAVARRGRIEVIDGGRRERRREKIVGDRLPAALLCMASATMPVVVTVLSVLDATVTPLTATDFDAFFSEKTIVVGVLSVMATVAAARTVGAPPFHRVSVRLFAPLAAGGAAPAP